MSAVAAGFFALVLVPQAFAGTFTVTTNADSGSGSLRAAVDAANANADTDTITFDSGLNLDVIALQSPITVTHPVTIDGGIVPSKVGVTIDGGAGAVEGIVLGPGSDGSRVSGLAFVHFHNEAGGAAVVVQSGGNTIAGDWFGIEANNDTTGPNDYGVSIEGGGLAATVDQNVVAGNDFIGNSVGIRLSYAKSTVIGVNAGPDQLPVALANPNDGNLISGSTGDAVQLGAGTSKTVVAGNFIGVDRSGGIASANGAGIHVTDSSGNQLGPGNAIAYNDGDGVTIDGASTGDRVVANSIHDNQGKGIALAAGANDDLPAPNIEKVANGTATGTVAGPSGATVWLELFGNSSCDGVGNRGGDTYLTFIPVSIPAGKTSASWSTPLGGLTTESGVTATSTHSTLNDTSEFSNCATVSSTAPSGSLSGDVTSPTPPPDPQHLPLVDLSRQGDSDWALWGSADDALSPDVRKSGGSAISSLALTDGGSVGSFRDDPGNPWRFAWSGGAPLELGNGVAAGLQVSNHGGGGGVSFTVPADTTERTLTIWASAHFATGRVTASLSDASAPTQSWELVGSSDSPWPIQNQAGVFTIHYSAGHPGATLTVTMTESVSACGQNCDDVILYAAALSGGGTVTGVTPELAASEPTVPMSGSDDPIANLPLSAFAPSQPGITPAPINGLPLNGLPLKGLPLNGLPLNGLPLNGLPLNGLPLNGLPLNGLPLNGLPLNGLPLNGLPLNGLAFPGGWAALLAGTPLAGKPLQTITLVQALDALKALPTPPTLPTLGQIDLSGSAFGRLTIGALALGGTPINGLGSAASGIESQLQSWCESATRAGTSDPAAACTLDAVGNQSLFALGLAGAPLNGLPLNGLPLNGLPLNGLPLNGLPLNGLSVSASPLNGLPLNGLPLSGLSWIDCSKVSHCVSGTLGDADRAGAFSSTATIGDLLQALLAPGSPVRYTLTLEDVIGLVIARSDVPWESLDPSVLAFFDGNRHTLHFAAGFTLQGSGTPTVATVKVVLPVGVDYVPGSAGEGDDPDIDRSTDGTTTLTWSRSNVSYGGPETIGFDVYSGADVGPMQATETVIAGGISESSSAPFEVTDSFEPNDTIDTAAVVIPDDRSGPGNVQVSAVSHPGDVDYFQVALPPAGERLQVHLTNLSADYDLALYSRESTSVRTAPSNGAPLQDGTVADQPLNLEGGLNAQLTPTALQDVPDPGVPVVQVSANRGRDDEDVGMVSPGGGTAYIAVYGYNGASSPHPYTLRVTTRASQAVSCASNPRTLSSTGSAGSLPASLPNDLNTLILVNEKRIGDTYGLTAEQNVVSALTRLAGDRSLGVSGAVIPVEGIAGVSALYQAWNLDPCSSDRANAVANAVADYVAQVKSGHPSLKYVVFTGGDDEIPFFRVPDLSLIANESGFASGFQANEYYGALASGDLLTDDPYLDTRPIPASGRQLFIPDLVGGRLVEKPDQIVGAITRFEQAQGILRSSTAFVSGYDFVKDGSALVQSRLTSTLGSANVRALINDTWSKTDLYGAAFPSSGPAAINDWNGHYDNHQALAANGDQSNLISTADLTGSRAFNGGIFFTMGCHAGFQTTDAIVGGAVLDWAEYFAGTGTGFVGNTGFGIGNTDSVAFSEELMADLAGHLDGSLSIGDAVTQAKRDYYLSRTAFSSYDEKTLSEAELYGLPMYGVGKAPTALAAPPASPDPVVGSSSSTSPSQGSLAPLSGISAKVAAFNVTPQFSAVQSGAHGQYLTNAGQVQAPNYRPLQPYVTLPATRSGGLTAHGVLIDGLTSHDDTQFNPDNVRPTLDLSANEPEPQFADEAWPTKIPTLVTLDDAGGTQQSLNLATGQFFTDATNGTGVERLWTHITGRVTYSSSNDFDPPQIDSIDAFISNGHVAFSGKFSDTGTGVKLAQVVYDVDNGGTWVALPLQPQGGSWTGGAAFNGNHVQFFVEACDDAGNCGFSSNKGRYFDAAPLPTGGGTITLTPSALPQAGGFYNGDLTVTVTSTTAQALTMTLDGKDAATSPVPISGDGVHILEVHASDGASATGVYVIDTGPPSAPVITGIVDGKTYPIADLPPASAIGCAASDAVSGATCVVTDYSSAYGQHTLTATATDGAGNTSTSHLTYIVGLKSGDILPPMAAKSGDQTNQKAADLVTSKINSTLPLKFQMYLDGARTKLMTVPPVGSTAKLTLVRADSTTDSSSGELVITSSADTGNIFRWTGSPDYQYIYNQKTKGLGAGTYYVTITVSLGGVTLATSDKQYFVLRS